MNLKEISLVQLSTTEVQETEGGMLIELFLAGVGCAMWAFDRGVTYGRSLAN